MHDYTNLWRNREDAGDIAQRHDADLVRESLRPLIFEEARVALSALRRASAVAPARRHCAEMS